MNMRRIIMVSLLTGLLAVWLAPASWAATYYVSQSSGNDASDGKSPATAWKTLAKASREYAPGDEILLKRGDTWANDTLRPQGSGTPDSRCNVGSNLTGH